MGARAPMAQPTRIRSDASWQHHGSAVVARVHSRPHRASRRAPGKHPRSKPARWDDLETQIPLEVILASQLHHLFQRPGEGTGVWSVASASPMHALEIQGWPRFHRKNLRKNGPGPAFKWLQT
jgi:hypothetical protein